MKLKPKYWYGDYVNIGYCRAVVKEIHYNWQYGFFEYDLDLTPTENCPKGAKEIKNKRLVKFSKQIIGFWDAPKKT